MTQPELPRLYTDLADWFHLLTAPEDYVEEADYYWRLILEAAETPPRTLLELGSGGGNMASHYKRHVQAVLVDPAPGMLALSRALNPECEHVEGDMRSIRLGREFDVVFAQDALDYLISEGDLRLAFETAFVHCRPGGVAVFAPDHVREKFASTTDCGGHDGAGRGIRYLEWTWDPDPSDTTYVADYAYLLRQDGQPMRTVHDRHVCGLFARTDWLRLLGEVGFLNTRVHYLEHPEVEAESVEVFVVRKPR